MSLLIVNLGGCFSGKGGEAILLKPGLISREALFEYPCSVWEDGGIVIFGAMDVKRNRFLLVSEIDSQGVWMPAKKIGFTGQNEMEAIFSPDRKRLYFSADNQKNRGKPHDLFYVERIGDGWGEPVKFPDEINSSSTEYYASSSANGNLYFTREGKGIFRSVYLNGAYQQAEKIEELSTYSFASHPFISPDESFIIFDARGKNSLGSADLFISFQKRGVFSEPVNLGDRISSRDWDAMASLSEDGRTLYFVRENSAGRDVFQAAFNSRWYRASGLW
ncbi:PD40 domain-containing protein [Spirochaeta isovalerica]|uniref:Tol biopolymer transport system component n=1 Tax=Spirochaeta isovalerica TaxID=150 RepID=A0A841R8E2_9SPIO|nr:PD40 domain-containing protein [Spirochaeta isovalerica]MBB6479457.1 Tol biopolymer transport system component [Spirochaeta isovalerica]